MISAQNVASLIGAKVVDPEGDKIGSVGQIYVDPATGLPNWATVKTGFFGSSESFVPLEQADEVGGELRVAFSKDFVKHSPRTAVDGEISHDEEASLYSYYHGDTDADGANAADADNASDSDGDNPSTVTRAGDADSPRTDDGDTPRRDDHNPAGPTTDDAMTLSEEQLHVGTERVVTGRARLRKHIVTEERTITVPVSHEEVRLERDPATDAAPPTERP
jgi:sporulation protein YlmC with PRC-barrel domain